MFRILTLICAWVTIWFGATNGGKVVQLTPTGAVGAQVTLAGAYECAWDGHYVWCNNGALFLGGTSTIKKIDPVSGTVADTLSTGGNGFILYAAGSIWAGGSGAVLRIDPVTDTVSATIATGGLPYQGDYDGNRYLFVSDVTSTNLLKIDTTNNTFTTIALNTGGNGDCYGVACESTHVWVSIAGGTVPAGGEHTIKKVDVATNAVLATVTLLPLTNPTHLGYDPSTSSVWATCADPNSNSFQQVNVNTQVITNTVIGFDNPQWSVFDGKYHYVSNWKNGVGTILSIVDPVTATTINTLTGLPAGLFGSCYVPVNNAMEIGG